jgi:hypothetical protein
MMSVVFTDSRISSCSSTGRITEPLMHASVAPTSSEGIKGSRNA